MKWLALLLSLLWPLAASAEGGFPALYAVTGVADNDVLNIRSGPDSGSDIVGILGPHQAGIEVTGSDANGNWLQVNTQETSGWAAARFLQRAEDDDYLFARALNCFGTEPFWSLDLIQGATATFSRLDNDPLSLRAGLVSRGSGSTGRYVVGFGQGLAVIEQRVCSDGMSDRLYALDADVVLVENGLTLYTGCCSIQPE